MGPQLTQELCQARVLTEPSCRLSQMVDELPFELLAPGQEEHCLRSRPACSIQGHR